MAIINNHSSINLDAGFQGDHSELLQFFFNQGLNIEITDDVSSLKTFLESLSDEEYPYNFDAAFTESFVDGDGFVLFFGCLLFTCFVQLVHMVGLLPSIMALVLVTISFYAFF